MSKEKEFIYYRESAIQSVLSDIGTMAVLVGGFYVNYRFIGNNGLLAGLIVVMALLFVTGKATSKKKIYTSKEALIKHLNEG